jgi:hypothetical protein
VNARIEDAKDRVIARRAFLKSALECRASEVILLALLVQVTEAEIALINELRTIDAPFSVAA